MFSIRMKTVRAINKMRGVDALELIRARMDAQITSGSMALYMGVPFIKYFDWEQGYEAIPKAQYEKALAYLYNRKKERERVASDAARNFGYRGE